MKGAGSAIARSAWLVPAVLAVVGVAEVFTVAGLPRVAAITVVLVPCVLLVGRRRHPLVFGTAAAAAVALIEPLGLPDDVLGVPVLALFAACFAVGRHEPAWWKGAVGLMAVNLIVHWSGSVTLPPLGDWLWAGALTFLPWFFGRLVRVHAEQNAALADQSRRLVEEGLTNALKHAPGASVVVRYERVADRVVVELASSGGAAPRLTSGGRGLVGMKERVAVFGGSLSAAPTADGGFLVQARLPLGEPV